MPSIGAIAVTDLNWSLAAAAAAITLMLGAGYSLFRILFPEARLPRSFKVLPGPPLPSGYRRLLGHQLEAMTRGPALMGEYWHDTYGPTIRLARPFGGSELSTVDPAALSFVYRASDERFVKAPAIRDIINANVGEGVLSVEGATHRRHRRVLNPAFGWPQIVDMVPSMWLKANALRDKMRQDIADPFRLPPADPRDDVPGSRVLNMFNELSNTALDIIGLVALGTDLGALAMDDKPNELRDAYNDVLRVGFQTDLWTVIRFAFPKIRHLVPLERDHVAHKCRSAVERYGSEVIAEKRKLLLDIDQGRLEKGTDVGKDVLSLLIKSNAAADLREDERLNDTEVIAQIATLLFTGHETTGTATAFCLRQLSLHPEIQRRLREELRTIDVDEPEFEVLDKLPYLHAVTRESLRFEGPVPLFTRLAVADVVVPLSQPVRGRDGSTVTSVQLKKGDYITAPYQAVNRLTEVWGPDAREFNPDRWHRPNTPAKKIPGVWGEIATFGGGPHNCIGHRMAVAEMKVLLFVLVRNFEYAPAPSGPVIKPKWIIIQRAVVEGREAEGPSMPLLVRPVEE